MSSVIKDLGELATERHIPRLLNSTEQEELASRTGPRRTIYYTKLVSRDTPGGEYARTHQYLGEWKGNQWEGKGTLEKSDGERYVGEWKEGQRHGTGTLWRRQKDGSLKKIYSGAWQGGLKSGRGLQNFEAADGKTTDVYVGEWHMGQRAGVGICNYADGGVYEGEWLHDKRHGFGVYDYKNGDHFEGLWVDDLKEGKGVHFYYHGEKKAHTKRYDGEWVDDVPKCGSYTEMPPDPMVPMTNDPDPIPGNELVDAEGVLAQRLAEIRTQRAAVRTRRISLEEHFTPEELEALELAFSRTDTASAGSLTLDQLPAAFGQVGMAPSAEEIAAVVAQLGKADDDATFVFAEFAQLADMLSPVE